MKSFGARAQGERLERMRASARWVGDGFRNVHAVLPGLRDSRAQRPTLGDFLRGDPRRVPGTRLPSVDPREAWRRAPETGLRATWLAHSTLLLEIDGVRVLTDPVWGTRASPFRLLGPARFQPMPLRLREMPPVDVIAITHDHYDHLDYPTIRALARHSSAPFVTSLGVGAHLQAWGVDASRITELDWWESHRVPGTELTISAAPAQHFSGRGLKDRNATLWSSLVFRGERHAVFFSGDTGLTSEYAAIRERFGPFDLVMLEIGAFHPAWGDIHLGPVNAVRAYEYLGGGALLPVHWATFSLSTHAWDEPAETLLGLAERRGVPLLMPCFGEAVEPARLAPVRPWWRGAPQAGAAPSAAPPQLTRELPWPLD